MTDQARYMKDQDLFLAYKKAADVLKSLGDEIKNRQFDWRVVADQGRALAPVATLICFHTSAAAGDVISVSEANKRVTAYLNSRMLEPQVTET